MKKAIIFLLVILFAMSSCAKKTITVGQDTTFPPMEYFDTDKKLKGFDIDLMEEIGKISSYNFEYKSVSFDNLLSGLAKDDYNMVASSITINDERKKLYDFSRPYLNAGQVIVVQENNSNTQLSEFSEKTIGAQSKTTGSDEVAKIPSIIQKTYSDIRLAFKDLKAGSIDGIVIDLPVALQLIKDPEFKGSLKIAGEPFTTELYGLVVKKGNAELLASLNNAIDTLIKNGTIEKLKAKWLR